MKWWTKFGCFLTGWNYNILRNCTEASQKALKKYTSSLLILMIIWGFIGYCFTERYINAPWWGCVISAVIFIIIIIQIERQIILSVGSNKFTATFRVLIAVIMSLIGASIIDQIIFKDDIEKKLVELRDDDVRKLLPARLLVIDQKLTDLSLSIDSLDKMNILLSEEIAKNPTLTRYSTQSNQVPVTNADGTTEIKTVYSTTQTHIENPRLRQIITNEEVLKQMRQQQEEYTRKKISAEEELRAEISSKTGFLEELKAILSLMEERTEALIFYFIVMLFFIFLELLVLFSKHGDKKSDYDLIIEHQLLVKEDALKELLKNRNQ
ncbi:MAG: DUF4407 domain-containing protein [Bacteroidales bacterium]